MFFYKCRLVSLLLVLGGFFISSCQTPQAGEVAGEISASSQVLSPQSIEVEVALAKKETFHKEIFSNGKLRAGKKAGLAFRVSGNIVAIFKENGNTVKKGETIARLDTRELQNKLARVENQLKKATLDLEDKLLGFGYQIADTVKIPDNILEMNKIRSGYSDALQDRSEAAYDLASASLQAPFDGIVANIAFMQNNRINAGSVFCEIIDPQSYEAVFGILENEIPSIHTGQQIAATPFAMDTINFKGKISAINPVIDKNGLIEVKARVQNRNNLLMEGMNVKVAILTNIPNQIIVPKKAVLLRSGKQVVFIYEKGLAKWKYVKTTHENSKSYSIAEGIAAGDSVIVDGNLNLGHDAHIQLRITNDSQLRITN